MLTLEIYDEIAYPAISSFYIEGISAPHGDVSYQPPWRSQRLCYCVSDVKYDGETFTPRGVQMMNILFLLPENEFLTCTNN
jgi:hypothetical protein